MSDGLLLLVRHAAAGDRAAWKGDDRLRPLDGRGRQQAAWLAGVLSGFRMRRLLSSPFRRCLESVEPFAEVARLAIDEEPRLAEGASESEARSLLADLAGESAALCTHGDVIARLLGPAAPAKKASIWALAADGGRPLRYIPPG